MIFGYSNLKDKKNQILLDVYKMRNLKSNILKIGHPLKSNKDDLHFEAQRKSIILKIEHPLKSSKYNLHFEVQRKLQIELNSVFIVYYYCQSMNCFNFIIIIIFYF